MSLTAEVAQNVRKGVLYYIGGEFTVMFDAKYMADHRQEYLMCLETIKKLRQKKYDDRRYSWNIPPADDATKCLSQLINWGITPTKDARAKLSDDLKRLAAIEAAQQRSNEVEVEISIPTAPKLVEVMKNYQKSGVQFMVTKKLAYNGDDMGLGKSLQTLAALEMAQSFPALIVCPVKLKQNWLAEARKWLPHRTASMRANDLSEITILAYTEVHNYVNYELASPKAKERKEAAENSKRFFFPSIQKIAAIACDEGHFIKHRDSRRTMSVTAIAQACACPVRFIMSGTPIENSPIEWLAPLHFFGLMPEFGNEFKFMTRYCGAVRGKFGMEMKGATNTKELHARLTQLCFIRRKKKDVLKELPDKIESVFDCELTNRSEYDRIERDAKIVLMQNQGSLLTDGQLKAKAMVKVGMLRKAAGMGKVDWIIEWIDTFLESGEKFVIYAYHPEVQERLVKGLQKWNPAVVLGGCKDVKAEEDKFMKDERCRVFVGSIVAAGFGITLTRASHIGIAELMWTHTKHQQTIDRVHRIGQKDCVNAYYFLAPGTIDDDMWALVSEKAKIVSSTTDGEEVTKSALLENLVRKFLT
jgi:SWI/SNF-related matrix-associated actin-dependent regulator of chromatin subfamily A-like protein 1